jgi:hypothetical protein
MFYFPAPGKFTIYPCNASKDGYVYAVARNREFTVLKERQTVQQDSIKQLILSNGSQEDILKFLENKNILNTKIFDFSHIYHLLTQKPFYLKVAQILKKKKIFDFTVFSYSIYHYDYETLRDFLNSPTMQTKIFH